MKKNLFMLFMAAGCLLLTSFNRGIMLRHVDKRLAGTNTIKIILADLSYTGTANAVHVTFTNENQSTVHQEYSLGATLAPVQVAGLQPGIYYLTISWPDKVFHRVDGLNPALGVGIFINGVRAAVLSLSGTGVNSLTTIKIP